MKAQFFEWSDSMFWLAGVLGLVAIGGVAMVDIFSDDDEAIEDDSDPDSGAELAETALPLDTDGFESLDLTGGPGTDFLSGGAGDDLLDGAAGQDQLNGYGGDDRLSGGDGDDILYGEDGEDALIGGGGEDELHGGSGADDLRGDAGDDQLFGHHGGDLLDGGLGADRLDGGLGDDVLMGGAGDDALQGAGGADRLDGGPGADTLFGGWGDDTLTGVEPMGSAQDSDFLNGGDGADSITAGAGDVVTAGEGGDSIVLGDWISGGAAADLTDFDPEEDQLVLVWDMKADPDPEIEVVADPVTPGLSHIVVNGSELASVQGSGAVTAGDIRLVDHADLPGLGLAGI